MDVVFFSFDLLSIVQNWLIAFCRPTNHPVNFVNLFPTRIAMFWKLIALCKNVVTKFQKDVELSLVKPTCWSSELSFLSTAEAAIGPSPFSDVYMTSGEGFCWHYVFLP